MSEEDQLDPSLEEVAYVQGVYKAFRKQVNEYAVLIEQLLELQGKVVLAEKQVKVARDHLCMVIERTGGVAPKDWDTTLASVRFVNMRLAEACLALLEENRVMTTKQLIRALDHGMYRWRTNTPIRGSQCRIVTPKGRYAARGKVDIRTTNAGNSLRSRSCIKQKVGSAPESGHSPYQRGRTLTGKASELGPHCLGVRISPSPPTSETGRDLHSSILRPVSGGSGFTACLGRTDKFYQTSFKF